MNNVQRSFGALAILFCGAGCEPLSAALSPDAWTVPAPVPKGQNVPAGKVRDPRDPPVDEAYTNAAVGIAVVKQAVDTAIAKGQSPPASLEAMAMDGLLSRSSFINPWGSTYAYRVTGPSSYRLCSGGPDRENSTADDICD